MHVPPLRSLTARLIGWVLAACGGIFILTLGISDRRSQASAIRAAEREADSRAETATSAIGQVMRSVEQSTHFFATRLDVAPPPIDRIESVIRGFLQSYPDIYGSTVALVSGASQKPFAPYVHRRGSGATELGVRDLSFPTYRYWEQDWFTEPVRTGKARWSEPYWDEGGGEVHMVTYSVPVGAPARAVVTADLDLAWLNRLVGEIHPGGNGFALILSPAGRLLAHSGDRWAGEQPFLGQIAPRERPQVEPILERMRAGGSGFDPVEIDSARYRMDYGPVGHGGWSIALFYPEAALLADVRSLRRVQLALLAGGLALLTLVVVVLSRRLTKPLTDLAVSADTLATGALDTELPAVRSQDEVGALTAAFHNMRDSLKQHIQDLQTATAAKERLESELHLARKIQMAMLPRGIAGGDRFELTATLVPARTVGGDLYDHFVHDGRLYFLVGDVSGKGIGAALFMARAKTLFETIAAREVEPGAILFELNRSLGVENDAGMFVTAALCMLDSVTGEVVYTCAGHDAPLFVPRSAQPRALEIFGGPVLGLLDGVDYPVGRVVLGVGDALLLFTDGVSEAQNAFGDFFGPDRLTTAVRLSSPTDTPSIAADVLGAVRAFAGGAPQSDDITILAVRYLGAKTSPTIH